jgi:hypothetical protein
VAAILGFPVGERERETERETVRERESNERVSAGRRERVLGLGFRRQGAGASERERCERERGSVRGGEREKRVEEREWPLTGLLKHGLGKLQIGPSSNN